VNFDSQLFLPINSEISIRQDMIKLYLSPKTGDFDMTRARENLVNDLITSNRLLQNLHKKPILIEFQRKRIEIISFVPFMDFDSDCPNDSFSFLDFFSDDQSPQRSSSATAVATPSPVASTALPNPFCQEIVLPESSKQQQGHEQQNLPRVQNKSGMTSPKASRVCFSPEAQREMSTWIVEHLQDSRLTREEENYFMTKYGATRKQIRTAFNNRRQRIATPLKVMHQEQRRQMFLQQLIVAGAQIHVQYWIQPPLPHAH
jgi:hypothetical protein